MSQSMRSLARLLICLRQRHDLDLSLAEYMDPQYFDDIADATKELGGCSMISAEGENVASFRTPSFPLKIGLALEKRATLLKDIGIKTKNDQFVKNGDLFSQLYKLEWSVKVASVSSRTQADNKFNKVQLLPLTVDLLKVREYSHISIPNALKTALHESATL